MRTKNVRLHHNGFMLKKLFASVGKKLYFGLKFDEQMKI